MNRLVVKKLIPGGQALATLSDGKKIFLWNALPGEEIDTYSIISQKKNYINAVATSLSVKSPYRVEPRDDCYLSTSPWQIMDYDYELEQKVELLREQFRQAGIAQNVFLSDFPQVTTEVKRRTPVTTGGADACRVKHICATDYRDFHYRNKMEYSLYWDNETQDIKLAFHQRGSHRKIPITQSSLERPEIFKKAKEIVADLNARHEEARKYQSLLLRCDQQGKVSGGLYENGKPHPVFNNLTDTLLGHEYSYSPNGFFQINLPVYEMALKEIKKHITTDKVLDLYAGVGTIGLSVARDKQLTLVECDNFAFQELEKNAQGTSAQTILSNSEEALDCIASDQTVIVDPPRAGCHVKLLERLLTQKPPTIIYLSCNPATQARDLKILEKSYKITQITPFNFFPRTPHLENLVILKSI